MKIIEAMKKVKANKEKIADLQAKIAQVSAHSSVETPLYGAETKTRITEWLQACYDLGQDSIHLLVSIQRTNLNTNVTINVGGQPVTKTIAEWVWRRREYAALDLASWSKLTDRGIKEGKVQFSQGAEPTAVTIIRNFDPMVRDKHLAMYKNEPNEIDAALEVINAVTDLIEGD